MTILPLDIDCMAGLAPLDQPTICQPTAKKAAVLGNERGGTYSAVQPSVHCAAPPRSLVKTTSLPPATGFLQICRVEVSLR